MPKKISRRSLRDDAFDAEESIDRRGRVMGQAEVEDFLEDDLVDDDDCEGLLDRPDLRHEPSQSDATDDPVRMYLMQMGQIPLLNRDRRFPPPGRSNARATATATGCWPPTTCCKGPSSCLKKSATGKLRLDRTIEVSRHQHDREKARSCSGSARTCRTLKAPAEAEQGRFPDRRQPQHADASPPRGLAQLADPPPQQGACG